MNPEETNYKKALLKVGIIVIVLAIIFLWLSNLQNVFESRQNQSDNLLKKISDDIDKSLKDTETHLNETVSTTSNTFVEKLLDKASSTIASTTSTSTAAVELKKELTGFIKATSTPKRISCPEYINCMPSIGETRPCVVPAGCEKITQIAY
jgi:hypothetical protein